MPELKYQKGSHQYKFHLEKYGHPSVFGFKYVINEWKAEKWDTEELAAFYKSAGSKYFIAMACGGQCQLSGKD